MEIGHFLVIFFGVVVSVAMLYGLIVIYPKAFNTNLKDEKDIRHDTVQLPEKVVPEPEIRCKFDFDFGNKLFVNYGNELKFVIDYTINNNLITFIDYVKYGTVPSEVKIKTSEIIRVFKERYRDKDIYFYNILIDDYIINDEDLISYNSDIKVKDEVLNKEWVKGIKDSLDKCILESELTDVELKPETDIIKEFSDEAFMNDLGFKDEEYSNIVLGLEDNKRINENKLSKKASCEYFKKHYPNDKILIEEKFVDFILDNGLIPSIPSDYINKIPYNQIERIKNTPVHESDKYRLGGVMCRAKKDELIDKNPKEELLLGVPLVVVSTINNFDSGKKSSPTYHRLFSLLPKPSQVNKVNKLSTPILFKRMTHLNNIHYLLVTDIDSIE